TVSDTLAAVLTKEPNLEAVPVRVRRVLRLCLAKDPRQRLGSIGDVRFLLEDTQAEGLRHRGFPWTVLTALLAFMTIALAIVYFRENPPETVPVRFQIPAPEKASFGAYGLAL